MFIRALPLLMVPATLKLLMTKPNSLICDLFLLKYYVILFIFQVNKASNSNVQSTQIKRYSDAEKYGTEKRLTRTLHTQCEAIKMNQENRQRSPKMTM